MERATGVEPATSSLGSWHSTTELLPLSLTKLSVAYAITCEQGQIFELENLRFSHQICTLLILKA